eukprot:g2276.t1
MALNYWLALFGYIIFEIRVFLHQVWLSCNFFLTQAFVPKSTDLRHKIVVIGDGFAQGFGDSSYFGGKSGIAQYLESFLRKESRVRQKWIVLNCGQRGARTSDWLPETEGNATNSFFKDTFSSSKYRDCEIVIISLGYHDHEVKALRDPETSRKNIQTIVSKLIDLNKIIYVLGIPNNSSVDNSGRNRLIRNYVKGCKEVKLPIYPGPQSSLLSAPTYYTFDSTHFNSTGYRILSHNIMKEIIASITKVEFKTWEKQLLPENDIIRTLRRKKLEGR